MAKQDLVDFYEKIRKSKGNFKMKQKILFTILCIGVLSIGTIVYASFIHTADTSLLSDREMIQISGKCTCYPDEDPQCRWYGSLECNTGSSCNSLEEIETDNWVPTYHTDGPPNGQVPYPSGSVDCYQYHHVTTDDPDQDYYCDSSNPIPQSEEDDWSEYWYSCSYSYGQSCTRCSVGDSYGGMVGRMGYGCCLN